MAGPYTAHGDFDSRAMGQSYLTWADTHRPWLAAAGLGVAAGLWAMLKR